MSGKKYYLTPDEFSVISAGFEIPMVYGLKQIDGMVDSKEICMALHSMYVNDLIKNRDSEEFVADDEITEAMRIIKAAERFVQMDFSVEDKLNTMCCYHGQRCAVAGESFLYPDKIILYLADWEDVVNEVLGLSEEMTFVLDLMNAQNGRILDKMIITPETDEIYKREKLETYYKEAEKL